MPKMEGIGNENSIDEAGGHGINGTSGPPKPSPSPPLINDGNDDNHEGQTTPGEGEVEPHDIPLVNGQDRGDQDCNNGVKIYVPRTYDVLLGRGRPLQDHPGNLRFHKIINRARTSYVNSRKEGKAGIAREVLYEIKSSKKSSESNINSNQPSVGDDDGVGDEMNSPSSGGEPGRFLKKLGDVNGSGEDIYWIEVSQEVAIEKISHALRGRPRSETSNRSDGPGANSGGGKGQSGIMGGRRRPSNVPIDSASGSGNPKRKDPPSPPTNETAPNADVGTNVSGVTTGGALLESGKEKAQQRSNITDAIFTTNVNTPNKIPSLLNTIESTTADNGSTNSAQPAHGTLDNQLQSILSAWQLQQFQAAMQLQHQSAQQVAQQQLFQQLMQQHQQNQRIAATGTSTAFGQNQQAPLNNGAVGQLPTQQQQLQLLLQQQQVQQVLQQQAQQLQPQQVQYVLQQSHIQPQQSQQQQQVQSTIQQPQQTQAQAQQQLEQYLQQQQQIELLAGQQHQGQGAGNPLKHGKTEKPQIHPVSYQQQQNQTATASSSGIGNPIASNTTAGGATMSPNLVTAATAILSAIQQATGNGSANAAVNTQNILSSASTILAAQQPQAAPNQMAQNPQSMVPQNSSGQIVATPDLQLQQQLHLQQQHQQHNQHPQQHPLQHQHQQLQQLQQQLQQQLLQQSQEFLAVLYPQQPLQQIPITDPNSSSTRTLQRQPQPPPGNPPPPNDPS